VFWSPGCGPFGVDEVTGSGCKDASNDGSKDARKVANRYSGEDSGKDAGEGDFDFRKDVTASTFRCSSRLSV
jgi:hypothetical protein